MRTEIYTAYAPNTDMTFIMQDTYEGDEIKATECIGWYHGEPDDKSTKTFIGKLKATFDDEPCTKTDAVTVICYGEEKVWESRSEAIAFYLEGIEACGGSERDRYMNVYIDLIEGRAVCTDGR